jgi:hypothetical protein
MTNEDLLKLEAKSNYNDDDDDDTGNVIEKPKYFKAKELAEVFNRIKLA